MRFLLQNILVALLLGACSMARADSTPERAEPPVPWPSLEEVQPDSGRQDTAQLLEWMLSADIARRSEAQIRLLALGDTLLPQLEVLAARSQGKDERGWMREYLQVLTARQVSLEQLAPYPTLNALAQEAVNRGLRAVSRWDRLASTEGLVVFQQGPSGWCGTPTGSHTELSLEGPFLRPLFNTLAHLGGAARPALERLLSSPSAATRVRGMVLASELGLRPHAAVLNRLLEDKATVTLLQGVHGDPIRLHGFFYLLTLADSLNSQFNRAPGGAQDGERRRSLLFEIEDRVAQWFAIANVPGYDPGGLSSRWPSLLVKPPLRYALARRARDEQEYWSTGRPLWRTWWRGEPWTAPGLTWKSVAGSQMGLQSIVSRSLAPGQPLFQINGPTGTEVEVLDATSASILRRGLLPLSLFNEVQGRSFILRMYIGQTSVDLNLAATASDPASVTLWVQPLLYQTYRKGEDGP